MTNLLTVLPDFDIRPYTHILPSLEKALISAADLLTLDAIDVAKRAQVPPGEVKKLCDALLESLRVRNSSPGPVDDAGVVDVRPAPLTIQDGLSIVEDWQCISTLDDVLDATLNGGIATRCLTEFVGER